MGIVRIRRDSLGPEHQDEMVFARIGPAGKGKKQQAGEEQAAAALPGGGDRFHGELLPPDMCRSKRTLTRRPMVLVKGVVLYRYCRERDWELRVLLHSQVGSHIMAMFSSPEKWCN